MPVLDGLRIQGRRRIPLAEIDAIVARRLGPGRVPGNAQPAAFSRQMAMYVANQVGGWSTTQIGKFYNGRDHSTVCYAIARIRARRRMDENIDGLLTVLANEIKSREQTRENSRKPRTVDHTQVVGSLLPEAVLETLAERIATRVLSHLTKDQRPTDAQVSRKPDIPDGCGDEARD